jgi:hypothetical protein
MLPNAQQLIEDVTLLLQKRFISKNIMSNEMAKRLERDAGKFYQIFLNNIRSPEATSRRFLNSFYSVFQADLDSIQKEKHIREHFSSIQPNHYEELLNGVLKSIENNKTLVLSNQKLVEAQLLLLAKLPDL